MNLDSAEYVLTTTRSVRKRLDLDRPVDRAVIEQCLEVALQAPNGSNLNTWRWVIVDDREKLRAIANLYGKAIDDFVEVLGPDTGENYIGAHIPRFDALSSSVDYLREHLAEVPMIAFSSDGWSAGERQCVLPGQYVGLHSSISVELYAGAENQGHG